MTNPKNTKIHLCPKSSSGLLAVDLIEEDEDGIISAGICIANGASIVNSKRYRVKDYQYKMTNK